MHHRIFICFLILFSTVSAQDLGLSDAIHQALETNYDIQIQQADERIAGIQNSWGGAGRFPTLSVSLTGTERENDDPSGAYSQNAVTGSVTLNWLLFDGFAVNIRKSRLGELENLSEGNTALLVENTIQSVIMAYYHCLLQQERMQVLEEVMQLSRDRYSYEQQRHELGSQTRYNLLQAQNAYLEDHTNYLRQRTVFRNSVRDLNYLMGIQNRTIYTFTDSFYVQPESFDLEALQNKLETNNTTLKNQYINLELLKKQLALKRSNWYPELSMRAGYDQSDSRMQFSGQPQSQSSAENQYASLTLSWNLFTGGSRRRATEIAKVDLANGEVGIEQMKHNLVNRLYNIYELYEVRKELLNLADESLQAAQINLDISEEKFKTGAINSFNYRDVQLIYLNAALNRLNSIYDLIDSHYSLIKLTGGIVSELGQF
ncbi:MAG: TolC family protein [candidate division KSB1 bacterium]|nr:TolC family protein [candidate division KSB1 bacterium]